LFTAVIFSCTPAVALDRSRQTSAEALKSSEMGDSARAIEIARTGLRECPAAGGSACRTLLNYTLGYVLQQQGQSATTADDRQRALNSAVASYKAALQDDPSNGTIRYNLSLLLTNLGDQAGAVAELQRAVQADLTQWRYSVKIGDLQVQQKDWQGAMQAYEQAVQSAPTAEAPAERVLELTRRAHGLKANELQARCKEWEGLHPALASNCYEQFMTMVHAENNAAAEAALVSWVDIVARQDNVDEHLLEALPRNWNTTAAPPLNNDNPKVVQGLLRHASYSITMNVYDEAMSEEKRNAHRGVIQQLNRRVTRSAPKPTIPQVIDKVGVPTTDIFEHVMETISEATPLYELCASVLKGFHCGGPRSLNAPAASFS